MNKNWHDIKGVRKLFSSLENKARFVGGCVRDALLDKELGDIDIATPLLPEEVITRLEKNNIKVIPTGLKHGTVTAIIENNNFEITTLRKDVDCDGRHAEVEYTDNWEEDAARRDFTINAMSCTIDGKLFDYFGGTEDLKNGAVKFVGDARQRCREDYLRILRFFRFFAWYGKQKADNNAQQACATLAKGLDSLSGERIQKEMLKLLLAENPVPAISLMQDLQVIGHIIPGQINLYALQNLITLKYKADTLSIVRLAALMCGSTSTDELAGRWKMSNEHKDLLRTLISSEDNITHDTVVTSQKKILRKMGRNIFKHLVILKWSEERDPEKYRTDYEQMFALADNWEIPVFPITGGDIVKLGIKPGPRIGEILRKAEQLWEENNYQPDFEQIVEYIKGITLL